MIRQSGSFKTSGVEFRLRRRTFALTIVRQREWQTGDCPRSIPEFV